MTFVCNQWLQDPDPSKHPFVELLPGAELPNMLLYKVEVATSELKVRAPTLPPCAAWHHSNGCIWHPSSASPCLRNDQGTCSSIEHSDLASSSMRVPHACSRALALFQPGGRSKPKRAASTAGTCKSAHPSMHHYCTRPSLQAHMHAG